MHEDKKTGIMSTQCNSLTQCTVEFLHWVIQVTLNLVLTHSLNFFIITKIFSDWYHFCEWKFLQSVLQLAVSVETMQLTLSIAIILVPTSVAIMQFLRFYCNYVCDTFSYIYLGGPFCCNYAGDCFCCNYAVRTWHHWDS